jgi:hypothetical protein
MEPNVTIPELVTQLSNVYDYISDNKERLKDTPVYSIFKFQINQFSKQLSYMYTLLKQYNPQTPLSDSSEDYESNKNEIIDINKVSIRPYDDISNNKIQPPTPFEELKQKNFVFKDQEKDIKANGNDGKEVQIKLSKNQRKRKNKRFRKELNKILDENIALNPENMRTDVYANLQDNNFKTTPGK